MNLTRSIGIKKGEELLNASKYNESIEAYDRAIDLNQSYAEGIIDVKGKPHSGKLGKNAGCQEPIEIPVTAQNGQ